MARTWGWCCRSYENVPQLQMLLVSKTTASKALFGVVGMHVYRVYCGAFSPPQGRPDTNGMGCVLGGIKGVGGRPLLFCAYLWLRSHCLFSCLTPPGIMPAIVDLYCSVVKNIEPHTRSLQIRGPRGGFRIRGCRPNWRASAQRGGLDPVRTQRARRGPRGRHHGQVLRVRRGEEPARQPRQAYWVRQGGLLLGVNSGGGCGVGFAV